MSKNVSIPDVLNDNYTWSKDSKKDLDNSVYPSSPSSGTKFMPKNSSNKETGNKDLTGDSKIDFSKIIIGIASPDEIRHLSRGEVTKPETLNYRTFKPVMDGLCCERIFGTTKDWECSCGKCKKIRYKNVVCDRCGVEVTRKKVRRERMGHIDLVIPIVHTWFFKMIPSKIGNLLGLSYSKLDKVVYYESYIVVQPGILQKEQKAKKMDLLTSNEYFDILKSLPEENKYLDDSDPDKFVAKIGGEAILTLLQQINLDELYSELKEQINNKSTRKQVRQTLLNRINVVKSFIDSRKTHENKPEWMVLRVLPVIPPDLRPTVSREGGKFATSDLNDLYRRIIVRNNRLKKLIEQNAPDVILNNEKRMLQEAVDALIDDSHNVSTTKRQLKSLTSIIKGKQGRFRQNLLGKRVDYSGRSVITVGPELKLYECGISKNMAVELFNPFIIRRLIERGYAKDVKIAKKIIMQKEPVIYEILENELKGHPVLLNRAPTLHKISILAFQPKLTEGNAIQLPPLVCPGFNSDFDGDQMAVHVPLSPEAITEASTLMLSAHNLLNDTNGLPTMQPNREMILGLYFLTKLVKSTPEFPVKGEGSVFSNPDEVIIAINNDKLSIHAQIRVRLKDKLTGETKIIETTGGRLIFNQYLPKEISYINELINNKRMQALVGEICSKSKTTEAVKFLDDVKKLGFDYAYVSGISFNANDIKIPTKKATLISEAQNTINEINTSYMMGLMTDNERYNQVINVWSNVTTQVADELIEELKNDKNGFNSIYLMLDSGSRGSKEQVKQLGGMRGLIAKPQCTNKDERQIIENPIISNFKEGLGVFEYFISSHGCRKGMADTALKTSNAGYLTRRLIDVMQNMVITMEDCGTANGILLSLAYDKYDMSTTLSDLILGRISAEDVKDHNKKIILKKGDEITVEKIHLLETVGIPQVRVRSVLTCKATQGVCAKCYGYCLSTGRMVNEGEAVGVLAAQSLGEPCTQLTLNTFHVGGATSGSAIASSISANCAGIVELSNVDFIVGKTNTSGSVQVVSRLGELKILHPVMKTVLMSHHIPYGSNLYVRSGDSVSVGTLLFDWDQYNSLIISVSSGKVSYSNINDTTSNVVQNNITGHVERVIIDNKYNKANICGIIVNTEDKSHLYNIPPNAHILVKDGEFVERGTVLAKIPRMMAMSEDIIGGLPRLVELFEVKSTQNPVVLSDIDGIVKIKNTDGVNREIIVQSIFNDKIKCKYLIPQSYYMSVHDGDYVKCGEALCSGQILLDDILHTQGILAVCKYLVKAIQAVYCLQGIKINCKHIELIIRQMISYVEIIDCGDTEFIYNQLVHKNDFYEANNKIQNCVVILDHGDSSQYADGQIINNYEYNMENSYLESKGLKCMTSRDTKCATASVKLQGITQIALKTKSFLSSASFQETVSVLANAAISGSCDTLYGLKENVITGHLIPAGTGYPKFRDLKIIYTPHKNEEKNDILVDIDTDNKIKDNEPMR